MNLLYLKMVPETGLEPALFRNQILSLARLPIPPFGQVLAIFTAITIILKKLVMSMIFK